MSAKSSLSADITTPSLSGLFNTTALVRHSSPLPVSTPAAAAAAVALLQDHKHYLGCNPHMTAHEAIPTPTPAPELPMSVQTASSSSSSSAEWRLFRVTDVVHALPAGLWDTDIVSRYEFCPIERGVFVRIRSPLGIVLESTWTVDETAGTLVEEILIRASRLLVPVLRSQCESGWRDIHRTMLAPLLVLDK